MPSFIETLQDRGYLHQCTDLEALSDAKTLTGYIGFDCTAESLHVGNLLTIMLLRQLEQHGYQPIVLLGGGTSKVGDPSGKDEARQLLTPEKIASNKAGIKADIDKFLKNPIYVDNAEWLESLNYIEFLRDYGRHFSVNRMLSMESVKGRLDREQSLSFLEFNYMLLQAYDFLELSRRYNCTLQMGGSDQWGNIVMGVDLVRRLAGETVYGLTTPLLTTADGKKMGKTAAGAVWLSAEKLSPYDFWQFWRNVDDADVERFLKLFTDLPLEEVARLAALPGNEINEAKKVLATEVTALCHGADAATQAAETARQTFEQGQAAITLPTFEIAPNTPVLDALLTVGFAKSKGEARRLIAGGGVRVNDAPVTDVESLVNLNESQLQLSPVKLSAGKKRHALLVAA